MMRMGELLASCEGVRWSSPAAPETQVRGICQDSREVTKGDLFVALPGDAADGRRFIDMALQREAGAVLIGLRRDGPGKLVSYAGPPPPAWRREIPVQPFAITGWGRPAPPAKSGRR